MKKYFFVLILLFVTPLLADYNKALELYVQEKFQDSLTSVAEELVVADDMEKKEENYKLRYLAAHNHWKLKNYKSALAHLKRCADIDTETVNPLIDIAFIYYEENKLKDSAIYIQKILKKEKNNALAYFLLGKIKFQYKNYWRAKEFFEKSLALDAELYYAWNDLGKTLMFLKRYSKANTAFATAHAMQPDSAQILNNLAVSFIQLNNKKEALEAVEKALKIDPQNNKILANKEKIEKMD